MVTIPETTLKSLGSQSTEVRRKGKRGRVWWWHDPQIKAIFTEFCRAEGKKICEGIEEALILYIQNYKASKVDLTLQVSLNKTISPKEKAEIRKGILEEITPSKRRQVKITSYNEVYVCPNEHTKKLQYYPDPNTGMPSVRHCRICKTLLIPRINLEMDKEAPTRIPRKPPKSGRKKRDPNQKQLEVLS